MTGEELRLRFNQSAGPRFPRSTVPEQDLTPRGIPVIRPGKAFMEFLRLSYELIKAKHLFPSSHFEKALERMQFILDEKDHIRRTDMAAEFYSRSKTNWFKYMAETDTKAAMYCLFQLSNIMSKGWDMVTTLDAKSGLVKEKMRIQVKQWIAAGIDPELLEANAVMLGLTGIAFVYERKPKEP